MSKVVSFSIPDQYLERLRSLYPETTENLAAKQCLIDYLDASNPVLDDGLDDKMASIEGRLKDALDARLDTNLDAMRNLILSLTDKISILESNSSKMLDANLDARLSSLEDKLNKELDASLDDGLDARITEIENLVGDRLFSLAERVAGLESAGVHKPTKEPNPVPCAVDSPAPTKKKGGRNRKEKPSGNEEIEIKTDPDGGMTGKYAVRYLARYHGVDISEGSLNKWQRETIPSTTAGKEVGKFLCLKDRRYYPKSSIDINPESPSPMNQESQTPIPLVQNDTEDTQENEIETQSFITL